MNQADLVGLSAGPTGYGHVQRHWCSASARGHTDVWVPTTRGAAASPLRKSLRSPFYIRVGWVLNMFNFLKGIYCFNILTNVKCFTLP